MYSILTKLASTVDAIITTGLLSDPVNQDKVIGD